MQERGLFFTKKTQILVYVAKKQYLCTQIAIVKQPCKYAEGQIKPRGQIDEGEQNRI